MWLYHSDTRKINVVGVKIWSRGRAVPTIKATFSFHLVNNGRYWTESSWNHDGWLNLIMKGSLSLAFKDEGWQQDGVLETAVCRLCHSVRLEHQAILRVKAPGKRGQA
jgi:hypothetical protein